MTIPLTIRQHIRERNSQCEQAQQQRNKARDWHAQLTGNRGNQHKIITIFAAADKEADIAFQAAVSETSRSNVCIQS